MVSFNIRTFKIINFKVFMSGLKKYVVFQLCQWYDINRLNTITCGAHHNPTNLVYSVYSRFPDLNSPYQSFVLLEVNPLCLISILFINFTLLVIIFNKINCSLLISENLISITIYSGGVLANNSIAFANYSRWTKMLR